MTDKEILKALSMPYITRKTIIAILNGSGIANSTIDKLLREKEIEKIAKGKYYTDDVIEKFRLTAYIKRLNKSAGSETD